MSNEKIVNHMIQFIEEKEKDFQANKINNNGESKIKSDIVKTILDELERAISNEDN